MSKTIDLRSDTVTRPGSGMREAIANAEVGDDVFGDDPTVIALEERVAALYEAEAAVYVPSGTMANFVALASLTSPGDEIILERQCHVFNYEVASVATFAGVQTNPLDGDRGVITAEQIKPCIREENLHMPPTRVIAIENTHNRAGGRVFPYDEMKAIKRLAEERGLRVHLDGARLANAHVETGISFADYYKCADTVSMCFSPGLGAPVGSVVVSTADRIAKARKIRKRVGGGMRQVGILAAAALYALDHHVERLREDHENARRLAEQIEEADGLAIHQPVETNIVIFRVDPGAFAVGEFLQKMGDAGVLAVPFGPGLVRMVTHLDVSAADIERVGEVLSGLDRR
jgi:threonine aldolase